MEGGGSSNCNSSSSNANGVTYSGLMGFGDTDTSCSAPGLSSLVMMMNNNNTPSSAAAAETAATSKLQFVSPPWMMSCFTTTTNNNNPNLLTHHQTQVDHDISMMLSSRMKSKIMAHPLFPRLLKAYVNCQKVGAPPEVVARLEQTCGGAAARQNCEARSGSVNGGGDDGDPALDQFMEAYCEMLTKYEEELTKPFKEAMLFFSKIDSHLKALTLNHSSSESASSSTVDFVARSGSSEEVVEDVMMNESNINPQAEDRELKVQLLRKYSGYLGSLKQEFMKKKKNGKLPKEARHQLLDWWTKHCKWPYPSEPQKVALAESTGLDLKQVNNWFINQRKRHWKPSEDMQFVLMDPTHQHHLPHYYMDSIARNPFTMDCTSTLH